MRIRRCNVTGWSFESLFIAGFSLNVYGLKRTGKLRARCEIFPPIARFMLISQSRISNKGMYSLFAIK